MRASVPFRTSAPQAQATRVLKPRELERATVLLDRVTDLACLRATLYARAGADIVDLGDDSGTQTTLPFGKPEDVREVVRRNLDICGEAGDIVIGPTHMVEPEVPWENLEAMRLAAKQYRRG